MKYNFILAIVALAILNAAGNGRKLLREPWADGNISALDRFVGAWELVSTEYTMKDGSKRPYPDVGPNGRGYLLYTADGHMCAQLVHSDRLLWKDPGHPTAAEKVAAMDGLTAYCGRFEIDESKQVVFHYPEVAWQPNFEGTKQPRPYVFENDRLTFSDQEQEEPGALRYTIVWRRLAAHPRN
jgi:hypothetical protein